MTQVVNRISDLMNRRKDNKHSNESHANHSSKVAKSTAQKPKIPKTLRYIIYLIGIIVFIGCCYMSVQTIRQLPIATITVNPDGLSKKQYALIKNTVNQQDMGSFFSADLQSMRDIILSFAWVDQVSLFRDWQQGIVITVLPKQAVAKFGTERLIDAKGEVFVPVDAQLLKQKSLVNLQGDTTKAPVIMQQMQQINDWYDPIGLKVVDIILTPRMTWLIHFDNDLRVIVDHENTAQKLLMLSNLLAGQLSDQREDIQSIDLRYKNGFSITWKDHVKNKHTQ